MSKGIKESADSAESFIDRVKIAIRSGDREKIDDVVSEVYVLDEGMHQLKVLNNLLILKGHYDHQPITKAIQDYGHPSSIGYIETVIENGFEHLEYSGSESDSIAKWFSHALSSIGTKEAIALIAKYSKSTDPGISAEMRYRLERIKT